MILDRCPCGRDWRHYQDPASAAAVASLVASLGPVQQVKVEGDTYLVPRDYTAQHGTVLRGNPLADRLPLLGSEGCIVFAHLPAITCCRCGRTSWNLMDVLHQFCGACGVFHRDEAAWVRTR